MASWHDVANADDIKTDQNMITWLAKRKIDADMFVKWLTGKESEAPISVNPPNGPQKNLAQKKIDHSKNQKSFGQSQNQYQKNSFGLVQNQKNNFGQTQNSSQNFFGSSQTSFNSSNQFSQRFDKMASQFPSTSQFSMAPPSPTPPQNFATPSVSNSNPSLRAIQVPFAKNYPNNIGVIVQCELTLFCDR